MVLEELHPRLACSLHIHIHTYAHMDICKCSYMHTQKEFCLLIQGLRNLEAKNFENIWCAIILPWSSNFLSYRSMIIVSWVSLSDCGSRRLQHLNYIKRQRKSKFWGFFPSCPSVFRRKKIFPKSSSLGTLPAIPSGTSDGVHIVGSDYGETRKMCTETFPS